LLGDPQLADVDAVGDQPPVDRRRLRRVDGEEQGVALDTYLLRSEKRLDQAPSLLQRRGPDEKRAPAASGAQLINGSLGNQLAFCDHAHAVAGQLDFVQQMAGEQDRAPALLELLDQRAHLDGALRVETAGGFVQDQKIRALEQRGRHTEPLLHSRRVGLEFVARAVGQVDQFEDGLDSRFRDAGIARHHPQVVAPREVRVKGWRLHHRTHAGQTRGTPGSCARDDSGPGCRMKQPR
jgi:hypothetical protein